HVRRTPGGEDRQQPDGCQDHRHQEHESHCICHAIDYPTFAAHPTVAAMTTVDNILPFLPLAQPCDDELHHATRIVVGVGVRADADVADATHQSVGIDAGNDLSRRSSGLEQLGADGDEAVEEVGMQCLERGRVGLQCAGQTALGDQEIHEEVDPVRQSGMRRVAVAQQDRTRIGARLDLVAVDGDDEVGSRREVPVDGADADAGCGCDVTHGHVDTGGNEGRGDDGLLVAPGVGTSTTIALIRGLTAAARVRADSSSSAGVTSPDRISSANPMAS
ncbi:MAG: hypothetical protein QOD97_3600, partial [Mycobacterium sp.]|nr:hypothetical protein [Mycobacterium sp.]